LQQVTVTTTVTAVFAHKLLILIRRLLPLPLLLPQEGVTILAQSPPQSDRKSMNVKKWDQIASINGYSPFYGLTRQQVCGNVYANGSMTNPENPPLRKMFAEFAQYLIEYKKTGKEDDDEEEEILADDGDDEEDDEEEGDWEEEIETAREPYNGLQPKVILQYFTTMKAQFFSRFEPLAFKGPSPYFYSIKSTKRL